MTLVFQTLLVLFLTQSIHGDDDPFSACQPFDCGKKIKPPENCGQLGFVLDHCQDGHPVFDLMSQKFQVLNIDLRGRVMKLAIMDVSICPENLTNIRFDSSPFSYTPKDQLITLLYDCDPPEIPGLLSYKCSINDVPRLAYFVVDEGLSHSNKWSSCKTSVVVPVLKEKLLGYLGGVFDVRKVLKEGFEVQWTMDEDKCKDCVDSAGKCGFNSTVNEFSCFCSHRKAYDQLIERCVDNDITQPPEPASLEERRHESSSSMERMMTRHLFQVRRSQKRGQMVARGGDRALMSGERAYDLFSWLLKERIICINGPITDDTLRVIITQLLFIESKNPSKPIHLYLNSPGGQHDL